MCSTIARCLAALGAIACIVLPFACHAPPTTSVSIAPKASTASSSSTTGEAPEVEVSDFQWTKPEAPLASADGRMVAVVYNAQEGNLKGVVDLVFEVLEVRPSRPDPRTLHKIDVLAYDESDAFIDHEISAEEIDARVARRLVEVRTFLARFSWTKMIDCGDGFRDGAVHRCEGTDIELGFGAPHLVVRESGRTVVDERHPDWTATPWGNCTFEAIITRAFVSPAQHFAVLEVSQLAGPDECGGEDRRIVVWSGS